MKKQRFPLLILLTVAFLFFTLGFFLGRASGHGEVVLAVPSSMQTAPTEGSLTAPLSGNSVTTDAVNINTATADELMTLPGIGQTYAQRILDYRKEKGRFSSVEELLNVQGIGEKRLEAILDLITIGG